MQTFLIAQAVIEHTVLTSMSETIEIARYRLENYVGQGNAPWVLIGVLAVVILAVVWHK